MIKTISFKLKSIKNVYQINKNMLQNLTTLLFQMSKLFLKFLDFDLLFTRLILALTHRHIHTILATHIHISCYTSTQFCYTYIHRVLATHLHNSCYTHIHRVLATHTPATLSLALVDYLALSKGVLPRRKIARR